jgi:hypothetical protein
MLATQHVFEPRSVAILHALDEGSSVAFDRDSRKVGLPALQGIPGGG